MDGGAFAADYMLDNTAWASSFSRAGRASEGRWTMDPSSQEDRVNGSMMSGQHKIITARPDAHGTGGRVGEGSLWENPKEDFRRETPYRITHPKRAPDTGPEVMEYHRRKAAIAYAGFEQHNPHKPRIIHTRHDDVADRIASHEAGTMAAIRDRANVQYVDGYMPGEWNRLAVETAKESQQAGPLGRVVSAISTFVTPWMGGSSKSLSDDVRVPGAHGVSYLGDSGGMTAQELSASLLADPTRQMAEFMAENPTEGNRMRSILREIAEQRDPPNWFQTRILNMVIHQSLAGAEYDKLYDPRMTEYVIPHDQRYIESGIIRRKLDDIRFVIADERLRPNLPSERELQKLIFPLAIHLARQGITPTVENLIPELDAIRDTSRVIEEVATRGGLRGLTVDAVETLMNEKEATLAAQIEPEVIDAMITARDMPDRYFTPLPIYPAGPRHVDTREILRGFADEYDSVGIAPMEQRYNASYYQRRTDRPERIGVGSMVSGAERAGRSIVASERFLPHNVGVARYS